MSVQSFAKRVYKAFKSCPTALKILPKGRYFAKSGHTGPESQMELTRAINNFSIRQT